FGGSPDAFDDVGGRVRVCVPIGSNGPESAEVPSLRVERDQLPRATGLFQERTHGGYDARSVSELAATGPVEQILVRHRAQQEVGKPAGDLPTAELDEAVAPDLIAELGAIEKLRRLEHRLDHQAHPVAERVAAGDQLRAFGEQRGKPRYFGGGQR